MSQHRIKVEQDKCVGCTRCMRICTTEAIRGRGAKAYIIDSRCIECGKCIPTCPHDAIRAGSDSLLQIRDFKYTVALPDPVLYAQFKNLYDTNLVLNGLLRIGFDDVYEIAAAAEIISFYTEDFKPQRQDLERPRIASNCPAVLRMIALKFPDLIPNIVQTVSPLQLSAIIARKKAAEKTGLSPEDIGVFGIVPCAAQVSAAHFPLMLEQPVLDGAFAIRDVYPLLLEEMPELLAEGAEPLSKLKHSGEKGVIWGYVGGQSVSHKEESYLAVSGMANCVEMLEQIDAGRIDEADFIELNACTQGCAGGCFTVENPFTAALRLRRLSKRMLPYFKPNRDFKPYEDIIKPTKEIEYSPVFLLDEDRGVAMDKMMRIKEIHDSLPHFDCGSCGAPSCHALAEDIVMGRAVLENCVFRRKRRSVTLG